MNESFNTYELVEKYCLGLMDDQEKLFFEIEMENNPALNQLVQEHLTLLRTFEHQQHKDFLKHFRAQENRLFFSHFPSFIYLAGLIV